MVAGGGGTGELNRTWGKTKGKMRGDWDERFPPPYPL